MKINKKQIGNLGEKVATMYLQKMNYKIIANNFYCRKGEIDIIAKENAEYVFIEVKTRKNLKYGYPIDAVNKIKTMHMRNTINYYLYINHLENIKIRTDVIEVYILNNKYKINHIKQVELF